ncbi:MAG TPA: hypothetical protein VK116_09300, partial [Planctomycetota bacterium]|nr:hypothetical protein [Planctomycetota bacterium]
ISADFEGNVRPPAVFVAYALERRELGETAFRGVVLDNAQQPIGGADCHIVFATGELASTTSAIDGSFSFVALEGSGPAKLFVDGLTATRLGGVDGEDIPAGSFPSLTFDIVVVSQAENSLPGPVLLPRLDPANAVVYDGTTDVELTVDGIEGLRMLVRAGSMRRANGTIPTPADPAILRLNHVHHDDVPMPMPDGAAPPFAWTLQPGGAQFDPPIEITYPNMSGLPAGAASYFLTFNHDTGRFEIVASGRVSEDGSTITSDPGSGLTLAGWGCNCPPYSVTGDCDDDPCEDSKNFMNDQCEATAGSGAGALNCQLACLANSACNPNSPPWVRCTINDYADNRRRGNHGPAEGFCRRIPSWIPTIVLPGVAFNAGDICFAVDGTAHLFNELVPTWTRKCNEVSDGEHNAFLFGTLVPCLLSNNHMSPPFRALGAGTVPLVANIAREIIQATCGDGGGNGIDGGVPPLPDPDDLFVTEIAEASQLRVEAEDDVFYVRVGEPISLRVTRRSDGANLTSAATGTQYFGVLAPRDGSDREIVAITGDGALTVTETPSPFAAVPVPFLVAVGNGEDLGLGQFAVIDADSDGDLLGDSYEELVGLDPDTPSQDDDDADEDGISDLSEALLGSSPT